MISFPWHAVTVECYIYIYKGFSKLLSALVYSVLLCSALVYMFLFNESCGVSISNFYTTELYYIFLIKLDMGSEVILDLSKCKCWLQFGRF